MLDGAKNVNIVGDFNNWDTNSHEMKQLKSGEFTSLIELEQGKSYQFRYLVNGNQWVNDSEADRYVINEFGAENCVVETV
jgi:1,4-alpha-glucan branching enzyme